MRKTTRLLTLTGILAGLTLSAMVSANAADTRDIKNTKSRMMDRSAYTQKVQREERADLRKAQIKSWKDSDVARRSGSGKRYLGGYRAWYGDSKYFGKKLNGVAGHRMGVIQSRYVRPNKSLTFNTYGYGYSNRMAQPCRNHVTAYSGRHNCACCKG